MQEIEKAEQQIAKDTGIEFTVYSNQGTVSDWVKGMQTAIGQKVDLIILDGAPDPRLLQPQLAAAKAAGIPVEVTHFYDVSMPDPPACDGCAGGVTAIVKSPLTAAAKAMADWTIVDSKGTADVLIVGVNGFLAVPTMVAAEKKAYADNCPKCKVKVVTQDPTKVGGSPIGEVSTALAQNSKTSYMNPLFDVLIPGSLASAQTAKRAGQIKIMSYNGSAFALKDVATASSPVKMDVAESAEWIAYANMDQAFRLLAGMPPVSEVTPIRVFDGSNIAEAGSTFTGGFGDAYVSGFRKIWGLS